MNLQAQLSQNFYCKTLCLYSMILALSVKLLFVEKTEEAFIGIPTQQEQKLPQAINTVHLLDVRSSGPFPTSDSEQKTPDAYSTCSLHAITKWKRKDSDGVTIK